MPARYLRSVLLVTAMVLGGSAHGLGQSPDATADPAAALEARLDELGSRLAALDEDAAGSEELLPLREAQQRLAEEIAALREEIARLASAAGPEGGEPEPASTPSPRSTQITPVDPQGLTPLPLGDPGQVSSGTAFNPAISVIPDGVYYNDNVSGRAQDFLRSAAGFGAGDVHDDDDDDGHVHNGGLDRGFNLREIEISFSGAVDPYFDVWTILSVGGDGLEIEEAYGRTRRLPGGLQAKFGRFFSDIGYLNRQHPHQWDFVDQALPYLALLDGTLSDLGIQLTWLPAAPVYTLLGVEALQGTGGAIGRYLGPDDDHSFFRDAAGPRLFSGFAKVAPDLGYSHALQVGVSGVRATTHQEEWAGANGHDHAPGHDDEDEEIEFLQGRAWLAGMDVVYKYDAPHAYGRGDLVLQGEYLYRARPLTVIAADHAEDVGEPRRFSQDGFYVQGRYGFAPRWTAGARFDTIGMTNRLDRGTVRETAGASRRLSLTVTFNPTEFSRLRAQYSRVSAAHDDDRERFHQVFVQYQLSLGVHGAHQF